MGQKNPKKKNTLPPDCKYNPKRVKKIIAYLEDGRHITHAAILSGITYNTLLNWIKWSDEGDERFSGFGDRVREARAIGERKLEEQVIALCHHDRKPDAKTLMHILATKNREVYGEESKVELSGKVEVGRLDLIKAIDEEENADGSGEDK
jgi:hypothetical protein